jgi:hypothetical protein
MGAWYLGCVLWLLLLLGKERKKKKRRWGCLRVFRSAEIDVERRE